MTQQQTATRAPRRPTRTQRRGWLIAAGLVLLSLLPVIAGTVRLTELTAVALLAAGWIINLAVAELAIRRSSIS